VETFLTFANALTLFAEDAPAGGGDAGPAAFLPSLIPFLAIFVIFYFLLLRPQKKEQSRRRDMLAAIQKNDRVVTIGGIYGVVTNVNRDADEVTVRVDETTNTKLKMTLSSISQVLGGESSDNSK
jgi:preprotein translocase subunit YajC